MTRIIPLSKKVTVFSQKWLATFTDYFYSFSAHHKQPWKEGKESIWQRVLKAKGRSGKEFWRQRVNLAKSLTMPWLDALIFLGRWPNDTYPPTSRNAHSHSVYTHFNKRNLIWSKFEAERVGPSKNVLHNNIPNFDMKHYNSPQSTMFSAIIYCMTMPGATHSLKMYASLVEDDLQLLIIPSPCARIFQQNIPHS